MIKTKAGRWVLSKEERAERLRKCMGYLKHNYGLTAAKAAAKRDGVTFSTSVWVTALGKLLMEAHDGH
jgi:hypothetical protein